MSGAVVGRMYDDGTCRVLSREGDWVKVRFDSGEGYVHSDYLLTGKQARSYLESMTAQSLTVSASALYVRREASADSEILTVLSRGTAVSPVHEKKARTAVADKVKKTGASASGNWIEVALGNRQKGYVCADYIGFSKAPAMDSQAVVSALNESAAARPAVTASVPAPAPSPVSAAPALTAPAVTEAEAVDIPVNTSLYDTPIADMTQEDTAAAEGAADPEPASPDERVLLASIIQAEAGNQSEEGMLAVGSVVMNRVNDDRFPDTISEVIYQPNQFTPASTGVLANILQTGPSEECLETADSLLEEGERNVSNLYFKSASYAHSHGINGRQIGDQVFH